MYRVLEAIVFSLYATLICTFYYYYYYYYYYPQVSSSYVYSLESYRVDKQTNRQTPLKTSTTSGKNPPEHNRYSFSADLVAETAGQFSFRSLCTNRLCPGTCMVGHQLLPAMLSSRLYPGRQLTYQQLLHHRSKCGRIIMRSSDVTYR